MWLYPHCSGICHDKRRPATPGSGRCRLSSERRAHATVFWSASAAFGVSLFLLLPSFPEDCKAPVANLTGIGLGAMWELQGGLFHKVPVSAPAATRHCGWLHQVCPKSGCKDIVFDGSALPARYCVQAPSSLRAVPPRTAQHQTLTSHAYPVVHFHTHARPARKKTYTDTDMCVFPRTPTAWFSLTFLVQGLDHENCCYGCQPPFLVRRLLRRFESAQTVTE